jgi:hypothetical protein
MSSETFVASSAGKFFEVPTPVCSATITLERLRQWRLRIFGEQ